MAISLQKALRLIEATHGKAAELGITVTTAVVDEGGHLVALGRMDGARWHTPHIAQGKAFTVAAFQRPGEQLERIADMSFFRALQTRMGGLIIAGKGAMPILEDGKVVGGIGVSGGSGEQDQECIEAALAAVG